MTPGASEPYGRSTQADVHAPLALAGHHDNPAKHQAVPGRRGFTARPRRWRWSGHFSTGTEEEGDVAAPATSGSLLWFTREAYWTSVKAMVVGVDHLDTVIAPIRKKICAGPRQHPEPCRDLGARRDQNQH